VDTIHISGTAAAIVVNFCAHVGYIKSLCMYDKPAINRRGPGKEPILNVRAPSDISGTAEARVIKFCTLIDYIKF